MPLDPQAAALVERLRRAGVVHPSQLSVAAARREGLRLAGTWLLDDASAAVVSQVQRLGRPSEVDLEDATGLSPSHLREVLTRLRSSGLVRRVESADDDYRWVGLMSGRRRSSADVTGALALLRNEESDDNVFAAVRDYEVAPDVDVRVYRPVAAGEVRLPVIFFVHGGGYVTGSIAMYDGICASLAELSGVAVASVGYRLAPEHPFPTAFEDTVAALRWIVDRGVALGLEVGRLAVMGDSVGGALCTSAALAAHREGWAKISLQVLVYPALDTERSLPAYTTFADGPVVSAADMEWYYAHYAAPAREPTASPVYAPDLSGAPPALIITAGIDPTHDDGAAYAERLVAHGVDVEYTDYEGMFHGFFQFCPTLDAATRAREQVAAEVRRRLVPHGVTPSAD